MYACRFMLSADLDENGVLSQVEVLEWVKRSKEKALVNDLQAKWISYDANKDGKISWGEFKKTTFASESSIGSLIGCPVFPGSLYCMHSSCC